MLFLIIRLIHITAAVAWAGGAFMMAGFVGPAAAALGPDGGKFMQYLAGPGRLTTYLSAAGGLTILSGLYLYWVRSGGLNPDWITSGPGLALTIGGLAGLAAAIFGGAGSGRAASRMAELGAQIGRAGGPPSAEQRAEMQALQERLAFMGRANALLLIIALLGMALAERL